MAAAAAAAALGVSCMLWHVPSSSAAPSLPSRSNSRFRRGCPSILHASFSSRHLSSFFRGMPFHCVQRWSLPEDMHFFNRNLKRRSRVVCEIMVEISGAPSKEGAKSQEPKAGSKIRVTAPLKVYHIPRIPELDLEGRDGEIKQVLMTWKGKPISANLPYKAQFELDVDGRQVKFLAHLRKGEFEVVS